LADSTSNNVVAKPMVSKKFLLGVLAFAVVAFSAILGSIFLKESLDQAAASKQSMPTGVANGPKPGMPGLSAAPAGPAEEPSEEKATEEKPTEEKPTEEKPTEEKPTEEKPTEEKPTEEKPDEEGKTEEKP